MKSKKEIINNWEVLIFKTRTAIALQQKGQLPKLNEELGNIINSCEQTRPPPPFSVAITATFSSPGSCLSSDAFL